MSKFGGKKCRLMTVMSLTIFFFFVEIIVGYISNSMALVADSFHMLGDVAALVISFLSIKVCLNIIMRVLIIMITNLLLINSICRCHQRNGLKIHLDGHVLKY